MAIEGRAIAYGTGLGGPKGPEPHSRLRAGARHPYRGRAMMPRYGVSNRALPKDHYWTLRRGERQCDYCAGDIELEAGHYRVWNHIRGLIYPTGAKGFASMPEWFPEIVCRECGEFLTPYVEMLTDIWFLEFYTKKLERIISNVRNPKDYKTENHWSAPVPARGCRELCA